ncbi:PREDICTED: uncharacterized protein LOC109159830 [Ipomoea nil]|uniref:uncharacterized protein LOC109159830 n=1 Tax=Ipomoea nil TaxID=35883 RepID=UPI000901D0CE|nr:PREDICTED: uncharacterized protein LOC109159830 [Ipomoea nil]
MKLDAMIEEIKTEKLFGDICGVSGDVVDEINMYYDCRYISACEATWRLFGYVIHYCMPPVERLNYHLKHQQNVVYGEDQSLDEIVENQEVKESQFTAWFEANKKYEDARSLTYAEFPNDDKEYIDGITESNYWASASALRRLFATLLTSSSITRPEVVRNAIWQFLDEDAQFHRQRLMHNPYLLLLKYDKQQFALVELEKLLSLWGKSLSDYLEMPILEENNIGLTENMLISEELAYHKESLKVEHETLVTQLTDEQKVVYNSVINDSDSKGGRLFFVYGYGGTCKTFVWKTLSSKIRSRGDIVLNVASSGIASLLLLGSRTSHSRFAIPLSVNEDFTCNISQGSDLCELIIKCKLIIWDEAPMTHKYCFETLDKTMRDILRFTVPGSDQKTFGGKTVVLGGDFRQILPVITKATRPMIVGATINSSYLWRNCKVLRLTKNLRLQSLASNEDRQTVDWFSRWIADIGDGITRFVNNGLFDIDIPPRFMLKCGPDPIATIVESIFPAAKYGMLEESHLEGRAILSPTLDVV